MNAQEKMLAVARGEALAANLLATAALQALLAVIADREKVLDHMTKIIDGTLNMSGPGKGDPNDELNTQMREVARFQAMQTLDALRGMIRNFPTER